MATVEESVLVDASLAETWDAYFDRNAWASWVDGFGSVLDAKDYPEVDGVLRWRSNAAGRGDVTERVLEHEERRLHRTEFADPAMAGELVTAFAIEGEGTRVAQSLTYGLLHRGPIAILAGVLFIRSQVRGSMRRSLLDFKEHAERASR